MFKYSKVINGVLMTALIAVISILDSVPPVSRDALIHHLAIPKLYLAQGKMFEIPELRFSYYPMNLDLLYLVSLYFNNDILPKFIHFAFALITAWLLFGYLKKRINSDYAMLGSLFFLSIPVIIYQSTIVYVDLGLVCFLFAAQIYLFKWIETDFKIKFLLTSAVFCGLALGTKYNGLIGLFLLGLFVPFIYSRYHAHRPHRSEKAVACAFFYVFVSLLVFSPWMIRNVVWTGNPVYPLYQKVFNNERIAAEPVNETEAANRPSMNQFQIRRDIYGESDWEIALIPLRVFFQGKDNDPKYFDGRSSPFLLFLPIFAFMGIAADRRQVKTEKILMLAFSVFFLLFACARTVIRIRYFAPIFPSLVILSMFGLRYIQSFLTEKCPQLSSLTKQLIIFGIVFVMIGLNAKYIVERIQYVQPMGYLSGQVSRDEYIQQFRPEYAAMQYANTHLTENDRILGVYTGNRGYYSDIDMVFSIQMLQELASNAESASGVVDGLKKQQITHLLINYELFNFWVRQYSLHEKKILKEFFINYTEKEFFEDGYGLLSLKRS